MSKVSEKAIYSDWSPVEINKPVTIIKAEFTKFNVHTMGDNATDESQFQDGILTGKEVVSEMGYGGVVKYTVKLNNGEVVTFNSSPREYFFKIVSKPTAGGKSRKQRKSKKASRRRLSRRHR